MEGETALIKLCLVITEKFKTAHLNFRFRERKHLKIK